MDLQDVRKFVRKGDDAVKLLESLGYRYESNVGNAPPRWVKPEGPLDPIYQAVEKLMGDLQAPLIKQLEEMTKEADKALKVGDDFEVAHVGLIPALHAFKHNHSLWRGQMFTARAIEDHPQQGLIVRFGRGVNNHGHWLPVKAVNKL